ncbi:hypothetical protein [Rhizosaccharibacter radicis]|uniref:Uncharacterized protein n=1 Tax=Rhizosaccharibacter radicis TaxID=2782605 RepID=A0ABT1VUW9_9PROT|nr:hypothetical protein [Acetobacteraceae bacterium KSS12]
MIFRPSAVRAPEDRTTGNVPVGDITPGGTRPGPEGGKRPAVQSGDENANPDRSTGDETRGADWSGSRPQPASGSRSGSSAGSGPENGPEEE